MPKQDKWQERTTLTVQDVTAKLAEMFELAPDDVRSWAVVMHVHNATEHSARIASSSEDPDVVAYQLMEGLMAL